MDKRVINKFAVQARRDLIDGVTRRLNQLGITAQGAADKEERSTSAAEYYVGNTQPLEGRDIARRAALVQRLQEMATKSDWATAYQDLIEEVAYTWFNRIIAIRFMEVNDYLPSRTRVLSSLENRNEPDIMRDALDLEDDLGQYTTEEHTLIQKAQELQQPNDLDAMYRMLFLKQVNKLNESLPKLFEKTDDFMTLLFTPSYNRGVIANLVTQIPEADFDIASDDSQGQVEIIGWLYQYYNQEPKDAAFKKRNYTQADIPAVTQLFTPDWIVKYLVENSVSRLWIDHLHAVGDQRSSRDLAQDFSWNYFMANAKQSDQVKLQVKTKQKSLKDLTPQDITVIDPSMGSGHILIYAFEVLVQIYVSEGYSQRESARQILEHNLFGADIDTRAFQLTYFAMMMKGRQYDRRIFNAGITPHVIDIPEVNWSVSDIDLLAQAAPEVLPALKTISTSFRHGNELGSLISLNLSKSTIDSLEELTKAQPVGQMTIESARLEVLSAQLSATLQGLSLLDGQYMISITNPPYMGSGKMPADLSKYVKKHYPNSKSDLFAVFMERLHALTVTDGYYAMITQHQWMFLSSFEALRQSLSKQTFVNLAHLGTRAFEEIGGEVVQSVAFVMQNSMPEDFVGTYERLVDFDSQSKKEVAYLEAVENPSVKYVYRANQANFGKIPGGPIAYWCTQHLFNVFDTVGSLGSFGVSRNGLQPKESSRFIRQWFEVNYNGISFHTKSISETKHSSYKWFPYNKGGGFRKWYGNYDYVVNWKNNGQEIRQIVRNGKPYAVIPSQQYYFQESLTWPKITSGIISSRYREPGSIPADAGNSTFFKNNNDLKYCMAVINSKVGNFLLDMLNPTMNLQTSNFSAVPIILKNQPHITDIVERCIRFAKTDWNLFETAWGFTQSIFLNSIAEHNRNWTVEAAYNQWAQEAGDRFNQLKANEEELNRIFIDLYGLQDELTPEVADKDVSVRKADLPRDIKAFLSYFIGAVFGRYSLDVPGLAFAGGEWDASKYQTFKPNTDDLILLTDEDYFGDQRDIINRLKEFLTTTFGAEHLSENLRFIADALGKKGDTPEEQIRKYFLDDFYKKDHLSTYQKRPIYWQLSSGRQGGFRALMYLHRYDENTLAMVRTSYLHPLQEAYGNRRTQLKNMIEVEVNAKQRNAMTKEVAKLDKQLDEITKYDISLQHVANMHIKLDLDDGVLVNHEKVQGGQKLLDPLK